MEPEGAQQAEQKMQSRNQQHIKQFMASNREDQERKLERQRCKDKEDRRRSIEQQLTRIELPTLANPGEKKGASEIQAIQQTRFPLQIQNQGSNYQHQLKARSEEEEMQKNKTSKELVTLNGAKDREEEDLHRNDRENNGNQLRMKNNELAAQEEEFRKKQEQVRNPTGQLRPEERENVSIEQQCTHPREELDGRGTNVKRKENLNHPKESDIDKATLRKQLRDESAQFRKLEEDFRKMKKRLEMVQEQRDESKKIEISLRKESDQAHKKLKVKVKNYLRNNYKIKENILS